MKPLLIAAILVVGVIIAARVTAWVNYFTFGKNRERLEAEKREKQNRS